MIAPKKLSEIVGVGGEAADVAGERIVFAKYAIHFQLGRELDFKLGPSTGGIKAANLRGGIGRVAAKQNGLADRSSDASRGTAAIEFTGKNQAPQNRNLPVRHCGPAVDVTVPRPVLAAVIPGGGNAQRVIEHRPGPCGAHGTSRLTGLFAGL